MKSVRLFVGGFFQKEYEGPDYGYEDYVTIKNSDYEELEFPLRTELKFNAFIDGTMKLYWIGNSAKSGTPLFYASVAVALLYRTPDKLLRNTTYTRNINLLIFPFKTYKEVFPIDFGPQVEEFIERLKREIRRFGLEIYTEDEIREKLDRGNSIAEVFDKKNVWIICDTSFSGITSDTKIRLIGENELGSYTAVKNKARARARHYMRLLEFFVLKEFKERNPESLVMVDGLFPDKRHVKKPFLVGSDEEYNEITEGVIGFIKRPMDIPQEMKEVYDFWERLTPGKAIVWEGNLKEKSNPKSGAEPYKFALMRFRYFPELQISPAGVVKIQANQITDEEEYKHILAAVYKERLPYVSSPGRSLNEPYPIEATEKVAKSFHPPEEIIRGFLSRYIPEIPYI
ncbi:hypothetical protein [Aquifex sp.]